MTNTDYNTALLLFSQSAGQEIFCKKFIDKHSKKSNIKIAQQLIDRSQRISRQTKLPFFLFDEKLQHGNYFGERLANAMCDVFEKGFDKIIVIGNDCPSLSAGLITETAIKLNTSDVLLAPTAKGGVYLIGISRLHFEKSLFEKINWQTSTVFEELLQYAEEKKSSTSCLPCLDDVNSYSDLVESLSCFSCTDSFRLAVTGIIASLHEFILQKFPQPYLQAVVVRRSLRGPPSFVMPA